MPAAKPFLILQLRPEDDTSNSEFEAILKYGELDAQDTERVRIEATGIPEVPLFCSCGVLISNGLPPTMTAA